VFIMIHCSTALRSLLAAATLLVPLTATAQSPRKVLVEEATNASCGPCAAQNPFFEYYLALPHNQADIIPVVYHAKYPGSDVMNAANPTMHNARVGFYPITGVPTAMVNGRIPASITGGYDGAPSDTVAITHDANTVRGTMSPITITISDTHNGSDVAGTIKVSSTTALNGKTLHIVAVEGHHYYTAAGGNGEKDFYYVARKMFPSESGSELTLAAGESKTFTANYTIDAGWNADEMYFVAFVQDPATREVLQAGTNRGSVAFSSNASSSVVLKENTPTAWNGDLSASQPGTYGVTITKSLPEGWGVDVKLAGESIQSGATITMQEGMPSPLSVAVTPTETSRSGKGLVTVSLKGDHGTEFSRSFTVYGSGLTAIVLQNDEGLETIGAAYEQALALGDVRYAVVERGDEHLFDMTQYPVVVYEVGKAALTGPQIDQLRSYFDMGGRMFMIGAEIGYGLADTANHDDNTPRDVEFYNNYLHVDYVKDANLSAPIKGAAGDPIGNGLSFSIQTGVKNQDTPDEIKPRDGAVPILYYGSTQSVAGIRYADAKNRLVYLGFGAEGIGNTQQRADLLKRGITWLLNLDPSSAPVDIATGSSLDAIRPNPTTGSFAVPFQLGRAGEVTIELFDMRGDRVATIASGMFAAGAHAPRFDATGLPAGAYTVVMNAAGSVSTRMVTVVR
jgi:hypothetical protein